MKYIIFIIAFLFSTVVNAGWEPVISWNNRIFVGEEVAIPVPRVTDRIKVRMMFLERIGKLNDEFYDNFNLKKYVAKVVVMLDDMKTEALFSSNVYVTSSDNALQTIRIVLRNDVEILEASVIKLSGMPPLVAIK